MKLPFTEKVCSTCKEGKATRLPFKEVTKPRSRRIGELIYADVWGPTNIPTPNDERYYVSLIDDYSHFCRVYLMKNKSETENVIIKFIKEMIAGNVKISKLRSDNGGEFTSKRLKAFCQENGIKQEYTCKYTPQQNAVAERMNRTILDKVRCMLLETNLPKYLWGEAVRNAVYQINRSPTRALDGETPAMKQFGKQDLNKLRVFGAKAWMLKLPKQSKLEPRAVAMRMIGYTGEGYRLWDSKTNNIEISRDVTFDENDYKYSDIIEPENPEIAEEDFSNHVSSEKPINKEERKTVRDTQEQEKRSTGYSDYELYSAYCLITKNQDDPKTYEEAMNNKEWQEAVKKEVNALENLKTWKEEELPHDRVAIDTKWVFKTKEDGTKKARLVARGYQIKESDFNYSPVARMSTIRVMLSHAIQKNWMLKQFDIPTAFLNGKLQSNVYIYCPRGIIAKTPTLKLNRSLYGLKESPKMYG